MWTFEQSSGRLYDETGYHAGTGYAGGNCGKNPEGINNPSMQNIPRVGPLPVGVYKAGKVFMQSKLGPFAVELVPDASNEMFGRGGFFMHGDTTPSGNASEGCIIMPRQVREEFFNSADSTVMVVEHFTPEEKNAA